MKRYEQIIGDYTNARARLKEAVQEAVSELEIDGVIQRFEFTFELSWKALMMYLKNEGITAKTPRSALKEAYSIGLISDEKNWLNMLEDRNRSVHIYDEETSREIFQRIRESYLPHLESLLTALTTR